jgi:hypothetical protein
MGALLLVLIIGIVYAGSFNCQFGSNKGKVESLNLDLGTVLWADGGSGKSTNISLPTNFDHYDGTQFSATLSKNNLTTPPGNFVLSLTVRLAGTKSFYTWWSKRNVVTVEVHDGDASGLFSSRQLWIRTFLLRATLPSPYRK